MKPIQFNRFWSEEGSTINCLKVSINFLGIDRTTNTDWVNPDYETLGDFGRPHQSDRTFHYYENIQKLYKQYMYYISCILLSLFQAIIKQHCGNISWTKWKVNLTIKLISLSINIFKWFVLFETSNHIYIIDYIGIRNFINDIRKLFLDRNSKFPDCIHALIKHTWYDTDVYITLYPNPI